MIRNLSYPGLFVLLVIAAPNILSTSALQDIPELKRQGDQWTFQYADLSGVISGGKQHGIELRAGADGKPLTGNMCLNLEHFLAKDFPNGRFVPRLESRCVPPL